MSEKKKIRR